MSIRSVAVGLPSGLVNPTVTLLVPPPTGVPEIEPVVVFTDKPAGRPLAEYAVAGTFPVIW
jgi:hypothetical protein